MKKLLVTTSWDDGHQLDERLANLLKKYDLPGTFYVSPEDREIKPQLRLRPEQIKKLSESFEIGAHTMTHPRLPKVSDEMAYQEIVKSKQYLEKITGKHIISFCYPGGNYQKKHLPMVKKAGMEYARTVRRHNFNWRGSLLEAGTTVNAYNHYQDMWKIARFAKFNPRRTTAYLQWDNLAKAMFDRALKDGEVYHLWGHSWEIDNNGDWEKLESVLAYISGRSGVRYVNNGDLVTAKKPKLLIAAPYFPPHNGGQEYYALRIAQQLSQTYGWDVCIATTGNRGLRPVRENYEGLNVYRLPYLFKLSNTPFHPLWSHWLRQIVKREDIGIINAHAPVPVFADIAVRATKLPTVVTYHMLSMKKNKKPADWLINLYEKQLLPRTLRRANYVICASEKVRNNFLRDYCDKTITITPAVDSDFFVPPERFNDKTILFVGSLNKSDGHKGLPYLLEAFADVIKDQPSAQLVVVGDGSSKAEHESTARSLGLSRNVRFLGALHGDKLKAAYQEASIFVLPSLNDNFPMVLLEAMASGLPVISTEVGSIPDIIDDTKNGFIVKPADAAALADKLLYLLGNPKVAKQLGEHGRAKVSENLTWANQAAKTQTVLQAALSDQELA